MDEVVAFNNSITSQEEINYSTNDNAESTENGFPPSVFSHLRPNPPSPPNPPTPTNDPSPYTLNVPEYDEDIGHARHQQLSENALKYQQKSRVQEDSTRRSNNIVATIAQKAITGTKFVSSYVASIPSMASGAMASIMPRTAHNIKKDLSAATPASVIKAINEITTAVPHPTKHVGVPYGALPVNLRTSAQAYFADAKDSLVKLIAMGVCHGGQHESLVASEVAGIIGSIATRVDNEVTLTGCFEQHSSPFSAPLHYIASKTYSFEQFATTYRRHYSGFVTDADMTHVYLALYGMRTSLRPVINLMSHMAMLTTLKELGIDPLVLPLMACPPSLLARTREYTIGLSDARSLGSFATKYMATLSVYESNQLIEAQHTRQTHPTIHAALGPLLTVTAGGDEPWKTALNRLASTAHTVEYTVMQDDTYQRHFISHMRAYNTFDSCREHAYKKYVLLSASSLEMEGHTSAIKANSVVTASQPITTISSIVASFQSESLRSHVLFASIADNASVWVNNVWYSCSTLLRLVFPIDDGFCPYAYDADTGKWYDQDAVEIRGERLTRHRLAYVRNTKVFFAQLKDAPTDILAKNGRMMVYDALTAPLFAVRFIAVKTASLRSHGLIFSASTVGDYTLVNPYDDILFNAATYFFRNYFPIPKVCLNSHAVTLAAFFHAVMKVPVAKASAGEEWTRAFIPTELWLLLLVILVALAIVPTKGVHKLCAAISIIATVYTSAISLSPAEDTGAPISWWRGGLLFTANADITTEVLIYNNCSGRYRLEDPVAAAYIAVGEIETPYSAAPMMLATPKTLTSLACRDFLYYVPSPANSSTTSVTVRGSTVTYPSSLGEVIFVEGVGCATYACLFTGLPQGVGVYAYSGALGPFASSGAGGFVCSWAANATTQELGVSTFKPVVNEPYRTLAGETTMNGQQKHNFPNSPWVRPFQADPSFTCDLPPTPHIMTYINNHYVYNDTGIGWYRVYENIIVPAADRFWPRSRLLCGLRGCASQKSIGWPHEAVSSNGEPWFWHGALVVNAGPAFTNPSYQCYRPGDRLVALTTPLNTAERMREINNQPRCPTESLSTNSEAISGPRYTLCYGSPNNITMVGLPCNVSGIRGRNYACLSCRSKFGASQTVSLTSTSGNHSYTFALSISQELITLPPSGRRPSSLFSPQDEDVGDNATYSASLSMIHSSGLRPSSSPQGEDEGDNVTHSASLSVRAPVSDSDEWAVNVSAAIIGLPPPTSPGIDKYKNWAIIATVFGGIVVGFMLLDSITFFMMGNLSGAALSLASATVRPFIITGSLLRCLWPQGGAVGYMEVGSDSLMVQGWLIGRFLARQKGLVSHDIGREIHSRTNVYSSRVAGYDKCVSIICRHAPALTWGFLSNAFLGAIVVAWGLHMRNPDCAVDYSFTLDGVQATIMATQPRSTIRITEAYDVPFGFTTGFQASGPEEPCHSIRGFTLPGATTTYEAWQNKRDAPRVVMQIPPLGTPSLAAVNQLEAVVGLCSSDFYLSVGTDYEVGNRLGDHVISACAGTVKWGVLYRNGGVRNLPTTTSLVLERAGRTSSLDADVIFDDNLPEHAGCEWFFLYDGVMRCVPSSLVAGAAVSVHMSPFNIKFPIGASQWSSDHRKAYSMKHRMLADPCGHNTRFCQCTEDECLTRIKNAEDYVTPIDSFRKVAPFGAPNIGTSPMIDVVIPPLPSSPFMENDVMDRYESKVGREYNNIPCLSDFERGKAGQRLTNNINGVWCNKFNRHGESVEFTVGSHYARMSKPTLKVGTPTPINIVDIYVAVPLSAKSCMIFVEDANVTRAALQVREYCLNEDIVTDGETLYCLQPCMLDGLLCDRTSTISANHSTMTIEYVRSYLSTAIVRTAEIGREHNDEATTYTIDTSGAFGLPWRTVGYGAGMTVGMVFIGLAAYVILRPSVQSVGYAPVQIKS